MCIFHVLQVCCSCPALQVLIHRCSRIALPWHCVMRTPSLSPPPPPAVSSPSPLEHHIGNQWPLRHWFPTSIFMLVITELYWVWLWVWMLMWRCIRKGRRCCGCSSGGIATSSLSGPWVRCIVALHACSRTWRAGPQCSSAACTVLVLDQYSTTPTSLQCRSGSNSTSVL